MEYFIRVVKMVENPQYEEAVKDYNERNRYSGFNPSHDSSRPTKMVEERVLETTLTEAEWNALRRASIDQI